MSEVTVNADSESARARGDSNPDVSNGENDTFEDATDKAEENEEGKTEAPQMDRSRSLTHRSSSSSKSATEKSESRPQSGVNGVSIPEEQKEKEKEATQSKSPLLTAHRLSTTSMNEVNLEDSVASKPEPIPKESPTPKPALPVRSAKSTFQGLSGALPSIPWAPPPTAPSQPAPPQAPMINTRKLTSPFSWLSRNTTAPKEQPVSPLPSPNRRDTQSSIATIGSNPELMLSKLEEGADTNGSRGSVRNSLKDRFKLLRMREEAGITSLGDDEKPASSSGSVALGTVTSPTSIDDRQSLASGPPSPLPQNPALAPGTASGVSAGPSSISDPAAPVDWDLWQNVVYEGPAAVARTSAEELNRAIAAGIPNAIRGVVWQVLAQSKNEELESVYRDLITRGTDKEKHRNSGSSVAPSINGSTNGKDTVESSASSIHSVQSTPATTLTNGVRSPSPANEKDAETMAKAQAAAVAEKKRKAKEDAAALNKLEKAIKRDLGARTSYSKYAASAGLQDGLFGICKAYALFDEGVGYAQGMNFLVMPLLFNMPEEEAFCLLVRLMNNYRLRDLFIHDMPGLHMHLYQFERLLEDLEPALYCHLHRKQVTPHLYATQWFLTLFAYRFPLQLVLRIYDLILSEGLEAILKFGIVLMQRNASALLALSDMAALTTFLKDRLFDVYIDAAPSSISILESGFFGSSAASIDKEVYRADQLIRDACAVKITPEMLKLYTLEWEETTRLAKERETELELLKAQNASLTLKIRVLEERVEEHDSEHAALATELVRTKVENEELMDRNESLKGQVDELRQVVEKQPEEVETKLKSEMERLMRRNEEVHGANTKLEEDMAIMEKDLVETKMSFAELNANHETLQRKWADLRKALN